MELNRRDFLKLTGASAGGLALYRFLKPEGRVAAAATVVNLHKPFGESTTICCYCAVGCGAIVAAGTNPERVINIEGDPDHPVNEGTLCSKGSALPQMRTVDGVTNPRRLTNPKRRAPGTSEWQDISWTDAIAQIAAKIKETRDANFKPTEDIGGTPYTVNRTDAIANFGGGELDNEECYLLVKMCRALGLVYVEHCARI